MNYKSLNDWNSGFHNWVVRRHPDNNRKQNGFMGGFIFGERGIGKSTYCYKLSAKVYQTLYGLDTKDSEEDAFKIALDYMLFDPYDLRSLLIRNKIHKRVTPMIVLDDASMHFGNTLHMINNKLYTAIRAATATIRTAVTGFVINAPKRTHVAKCLRDYDDYKGEAMIAMGAENMLRENWNRKIRYYKWHWYPDEKKFNIKIPFQDKYSCFIPEPFYTWYTDKKNYFEVKYEVDVANKIDPSTRNIFVEVMDDLPSYPGKPDLRQIVNSWDDVEVTVDKGGRVKQDGLKRRLSSITQNQK